MRKDNELLAEANKRKKIHFSDYCTDEMDVSSPCERLDPEYQAHLDSLKPWWEQQDGDHEWIEKTERELF